MRLSAKNIASVGMVIDEKSEIQLSIETNIPKSLQYIPRLDEITYKYLGFETKKGEIDRKLMMRRLECRIKKLDEPKRKAEVFFNQKQENIVNKNIPSLIRVYSGPVKFTMVFQTPTTVN